MQPGIVHGNKILPAARAYLKRSHNRVDEDSVLVEGDYYELDAVVRLQPHPWARRSDAVGVVSRKASMGRVNLDHSRDGEEIAPAEGIMKEFGLDGQDLECVLGEIIA